MNLIEQYPYVAGILVGWLGNVIWNWAKAHWQANGDLFIPTRKKANRGGPLPTIDSVHPGALKKD